jgi:hypothetical protein
MQIVCSAIVLIFMNWCYLLISFNLESIVAQRSEEESAAEIYPSDASSEIELADLLDLDIFDFDVDELADREEDRKILADRLHHRADRMA